MKKPFVLLVVAALTIPTFAFAAPSNNALDKKLKQIDKRVKRLEKQPVVYDANGRRIGYAQVQPSTSGVQSIAMYSKKFNLVVNAEWGDNYQSWNNGTLYFEGSDCEGNPYIVVHSHAGDYPPFVDTGYVYQGYAWVSDGSQPGPAPAVGSYYWKNDCYVYYDNYGIEDFLELPHSERWLYELPLEIR